MKRLLRGVLGLGMLVLISPACLADEDSLTLGVLSYRSREETVQRWQPLADYLSRSLRGYPVHIVAADYSELEDALRRRGIDVLLTNPGHYIRLRQDNSLSGALATLTETVEGKPLSAFGGVIFTPAGRADIARLADLNGKTLATVGENSLGGYQVQAYELAQVGIQIPKHARLLKTGMPHDAVVQAVLDGKADAGFVRSGILENLAQDGRLDLARVKVLNPQDLPGYPHAVSTPLYPEWPVVAAPHLDGRLASRVTAALLGLEPQDPVAKAMKIYGFTIPADYSPVEELLRVLRLPPFEQAPAFSLKDVWLRYRPAISALVLLAALVAALSFWLLLSNRRLAAARRAARSSEAKLATILDNVGAYIYIKNTAYQYVFANHGVCALFGAPPETILGRDDFSFFHADTAARLRINDRRVIEDGQRIEIVETNRIEHTGEQRSYLSVKLPLRDENGRIYALCGISTDITERKRMDDALAREKLRYEQLLKTAVDGIHVLDPQGRLLEASDSFYRMLGYPRETSLRISDWDAQWAEQELLQKISEILREDAVFETRHRRADGRVFDVEVSARGIQLDGQALVYASARDISARKAADEALRRSNADLEQFAYAISHDLRQPLRMVGSYLQLIEKALHDRLDPESRQYFAYAVEGAQRMDGMIRSVLEFSRVGRVTSPMSRIPSRTALDDALVFLGPEVAASAGSIDVTGDWPDILASREEMGRLFQNLIGNALKYHERDTPPAVTVHARRDGDSWRVEVRDRGIGIDPGQTGRLFQVFSRLQPRTRFDGTGVGLALCRKIVERHRGQIGVESAGEGQGSTFWFTLPLGHEQTPTR